MAAQLGAKSEYIRQETLVERKTRLGTCLFLELISIASRADQIVRKIKFLFMETGIHLS